MKFLLTHKIVSVTLSFLVLFSTLSLTIEKHFCGDVLIDVAIFTETEKCSDDLIENIESNLIKKTCCKDEIDIVEGLSEIAINSFEDLDDIQKQVLLAYSLSYINLFENLPELVIPHKDYSSPILIKDIHVLVETYLI
ncbi:HYC_CC_PP family protein [Winogradskyella pulchriflava]|uniref:Secreted protein n=1 Tax=Winogradskyella pulchriflava TaxID=1110688 RepID=A0ABV6Q8M5_9FLAO